MTTFALAPSLHLTEPSTKNMSTEASLLQSTQNTDATFGVPADFHFSDNVFGLEEDAVVDDLLQELGIIPLIGCESSAPVGEENGLNSTIFFEAENRSVSPEIDCPVEPAPVPSTPCTAPGLTRAVTLDKLNTFSVPNPILKYCGTAKPQTSKVMNKSSLAKQDKQGQKRKLSNISVDKELTEEELQERRQRNRNHAKKSRQRKKALTVLLQESVDELKRENQKLRQEVNAIIGHKKTEAIMAERRERNRSNFMTALMDPKNRVLDNAAMSFMKNLRKNLPSHDS